MQIVFTLATFYQESGVKIFFQKYYTLFKSGTEVFVTSQYI